MSTKKLDIEQSYDFNKKRHFANGSTIVFHCHHFTALTTQLALDSEKLADGVRLLIESSEDCFRDFFNTIYLRQNANSISDKVQLAEEYFAWVGLGKLKVVSLGENGGEVELTHSHVDEAWLKKWGKSETPINFIGQGFICALFSNIYNKHSRSYHAQEQLSIACGDVKSKFIVVTK